MGEPSLSLRNILVETLESEHSFDGDHLEDDQLIAYHEKRLAPEDADRIRRHLLGCAECRSLLLGYSALEQAAGPAERTESDPAQIARARTRLHQRAIEEGIQPQRSRSTGWPQTAALPAAAVFAAICLGLSGLYLQSREQLKKISRPRANSPIVDVYPTHDPVRGAEPAALELADGAGDIVLILHLNDRAANSSHEVRLFDPSNDEIWTTSGLEVGPHRTATLSLPRRFLGPGLYRLQVTDRAGAPPADFLIEAQPP